MNEIEKEIEEMAIEIAKRDCYLFEKCPKEPKHNCLSQDPSIMLESSKPYITFATWLFNAGYRNVKDKVVLDKEEYEELQCSDDAYAKQYMANCILVAEKKKLQKELAKASELKAETIKLAKQETARDFAKKLKKVIHERDYVEGYAYLGICEEIDELAKQYGVEVE